MRRRHPAAWGLTAALAVVAACSGNGDDGATTDEDAAASTDAAPVASCDLITVEEVNALVGHPVTRGPEQAGERCEWTAETTGGIGTFPAEHWVELNVLEPPVSTVEGMMNSTYGDPEAVADLGDEALFVVTSPSASTPAMQAGYSDSARIVTLTYEVRYADGAVDLGPRADALVELLRRADRRVSGS